MSASFPQLLRRSAFAQHDPMITRIYASNPTSQRIGDWGLKFPVVRGTKSRYIKVGSLDAGRGVRAEWSSGEKETRIVQMWGDGRVPWVTRSDRNAQPKRPSLHHIYMEDELAGPSPTPQALLNVESMTKAEFEKYLKYIRSRRHELREQLYSSPESGVGTPAEEATLPHAAAKGLARETASADFQSSLSAKDFSDPSSKRLHGRPHKLHGLAYSSAPAAGASLDPTRVHKGRVLDNVPRGRSASGMYRRGAQDINTEWVVGIGGVTALGASGVSRVSDKARLSQFDYARERPNKGIADFKVSEAVLEAPIKVLDLNGKAQGGRHWLERNYSALRRTQPLSSFNFDIKVEEEAEKKPEVGGVEWVAREKSAAAPVGNEFNMGVLGGLGGPRAQRVGGAGRDAARRLGAQSNGAATIESLLAKIAGNKR